MVASAHLQTPEERAEAEKRRAESEKAEREKLAEILSPHQMKRLNEIYYQQLGTGIFENATAVAELKITDDQKAKVAEIRTANQESSRAAMQELFAGGAGGGGLSDEQRTKLADMRKKNDDKLLAVLTADQTKKLEELKGKPFAMPENAFGRGRGGPGGGGPPGGAPGGRRGGNNNPPNP